MSRNNSKQLPSEIIRPSRSRITSQSGFSTSMRDRPIVYNAQHIDDLGRKHSINTQERRHSRLDEGSLQMTNDPNSVFYRRLSETLQQQNPNEIHSKKEEEDKFKLFEQYGPELVEFMKDREGHLKTKFDKVFIT